MRYDDRLKTALNGPLPEGGAAASQWRQVVDLLAQEPEYITAGDVEAGLARLSDLHDRVQEADRVAAVEALNGRLRSTRLLAYLCADSDPICDAAIDAADLTDGQWRDIIPYLSLQGRNRLQARADLGPKAQDALNRHAPARIDLPLILVSANDDVPETTDNASYEDPETAPETVTENDRPEPGVLEISQISSLVSKIEDYKRYRETQMSKPEIRGDAFETVDAINFETDDSGTVIWAEGPPQGAIVGVTIAEPAFDDGPGPDAYGAAAFRQRMPFENARMRLCGAPIIVGDWRMTAVPYFGEETGRFRGYRGIMKRPNAAEDAAHDSLDVERREQLQQLIHELRTPLNAIIGFSEIIEQQLFGPASSEYRKLSGNITEEARRLLTGFEDLDIAAKIDAGQIESLSGLTEPEWLIARLEQRLESLTESRSVDLQINVKQPVMPFAHETESIERIFARLLSAAIIGCETGEQLTADLYTQFEASPTNHFRMTRPSLIRGISEEKLLDPSYGIDGDVQDAPLLGLGFSLRLVRNLAKSANGLLSISDDMIVLTMPAAAYSEMADRETEFE
ncbi:HAMP domain-containing sensor histidine kinase [Parasphingorhabdus sp.]|uniref:sensor histidine kinase n=1 Tax=Parasphingorhabdus sp. TaxID=2709688 RepID=UPI002F935B7F